MSLTRDLRLDAIYARLPRLDCQRRCQESCGPIIVPMAEWRRVVGLLGYEPTADADQRRRGRCPLLDEATGACTIYRVRPLICRLFGLVEKMRCPWGCIPERWLTDAEAHALMADIEAVASSG